MEFSGASTDSDPWAYLPRDLVCENISYITDINDIVNLFRVSKSFRENVDCVQVITSQSIVSVQLSSLTSFTNLRWIDHRVIISVDTVQLNSLNTLRHAHFLINDVNLLGTLLQLLPKVNEHYFKISLVLPEGLKIISILIKNGDYVIVPLNSKYVNLINIPGLNKIIIPRTDDGFNQLALLREPLKRFLREGDFGLTDPSQPPSEDNPPLSEFTRYISDAASTKILVLLLPAYVKYNLLETATDRRFLRADELMRTYFSFQIDAYNTKTIESSIGQSQPQIVLPTQQRQPIDMNRMLHAHLSVIISANRLNTMTPQELAEYEFPEIIPSPDDLARINNIISHARNIYVQLHTQAKTTPGIFFYTTDGSKRYLS